MSPAARPLFFPPEAKRPIHHCAHPAPIPTTYHYYLPPRHAARNDHPVYTSYRPHQTVQRAKKIPNAFDRRKIPSPAVFICCIFRQVFFSTHIARASSETKPGGHRASKRVAPLFGGGTCVSWFNPSKPGVWGLGACLGVFHEGRNKGLADLIPYPIIYLLDLREMYLYVLT